MTERFRPRRFGPASRLAAALSVASYAVFGTLLLGAAGCASDPPIVSVQKESHPSGGKFIVTATLQGWNRGYYSAAVTIHNETGQTVFLKPEMFRLEGTAPTSFVPADRIPMMFGRAGYRMPEHIDARCTGQGEIFYGIRGTEVPKGPVRFVAGLPDGEHTFEFNVIQ